MVVCVSFTCKDTEWHTLTARITPPVPSGSQGVSSTESGIYILHIYPVVKALLSFEVNPIQYVLEVTVSWL